MERIIDDKDLKILEVLKENGDYTTRQIAKKTLLPATTIHNRIKKLRKNGVIKNFTINLDYEKIGKGFVVYVLIKVDLKLLKQNKISQYDIAKKIKKFDFVERTDIVTGGTDIIAIVRVKDVKEYDEVLLQKIQMIEGIENTTSFTVIHEA
ncbi:Lrp/AsnC family transcriptional regulator [Candidatus Woesearchaeota archaeon]|nr:MAG: Lrp/AsnC family transcriptional regulator [Candidatus Woesearchaeota archaeon]